MIQKHGNIRPLQADVTKKVDLERAASTVQAEQGFVNVVIANSGINGPSLSTLPPNPRVSDLRSQLWAVDEAEFTNTYAVNAAGVYYSAVAFLELLDEGNQRGNLKQRSQIIATSSIGAFNRSAAIGGYAYGSSKAATIHMMKQLTTGLVPYNIRANTIAPGRKSDWFRARNFFMCSSQDANQSLVYPSEMSSYIVARRGDTKWPKSMIPEERAGDAEDIVGAVMFLVSKAGAYINGMVLLSDGGRAGVIPATY